MLLLHLYLFNDNSHSDFFWQFHEYANFVWKEMRLGAVLELSFIMKFLLILNLIFLCVVFSVHYINIMVIEGLIWILHVHIFLI